MVLFLITLTYNFLFVLQLYESFPSVMKHLPGPHNKLFTNFDLVKDFIHEEVEKHKKDLDHNNPRDYIDTFLIEMDKVRKKKANTPWNTEAVASFGKPAHYCCIPFYHPEQHKEPELGFNETNLTLCSLDLFLAGTETTSTTLQWALVYLINHPDVQGR